MTLTELDNYFNSFLKKEDYSGDISLNGIQISNSDPDGKEIKKVAFAVDACEATAKIAAELGADVLFVHHGLFWGACQTITGSLYKRVAALIKNDIALCAYHIPLDANNPYGNNYGLANRIGLKNLEPFGTWRGMTLGVKGELPDAITLETLSDKLMRPGKMPVSIIRSGKKVVRTIGIISGGGSSDVEAAVAENLDCYITGEFIHQDYHFASENGINVIAGGHYETETVGVSLVKEKLEKEKGIDCVFIDLPTGL
ncbi:MAG: Nif3-like dinuclear metal center hexameric protein [Treponema sp.]|nr:Nif3-like dinuclear metal center hexameric protein [Treponema sp.]